MSSLLAFDPAAAQGQHRQIDVVEIQLPLRLESTQGVFVVHHAATPFSSARREARFVGWWLSREHEQLYLYPVLISDIQGVVRALSDLREQFDVDLKELSRDAPSLSKSLTARRAVIRRTWVPATRNRALRLMGFQPSPTNDPTDDVGIIAAECPLPPDDMINSGGTNIRARDDYGPGQAISDAAMVAACGGCSGPCCNMSCNDSNACTHDYCVNGTCYHQNNPDGIACTSDQDTCTNDRCFGGRCMHYSICPNTGDYCTDEQCDNGTCITVDGTLGCPSIFVVDSQGHPPETPYTRSACAVIPMGTDCVRVKVWYFSREYPTFTGQSSVFNDTLSYQLMIPGEDMQTGSVNVNELHNGFQENGYYLVSDEQYHLASWTDYDPVEIRMRATATNIRDNQLGSAVIIEILCDVVDVDISGLSENEEFDPGLYYWRNDDDDNGNGVPDKDDVGLVFLDNDLLAVSVAMMTDDDYVGYIELSAPSGSSRIRVYSAQDRSGPLSLNQYWLAQQLPASVWVETIAASTAERDVHLRVRKAGCYDHVKLTIIHAEMDPVTEGTSPIPLNPAVVAPMNPLNLDNGTMFWDANTFGLTKLQPESLDLQEHDVSWDFDVLSGSMSQTQIVVSEDQRQARLQFPPPFPGNFGEGRMKFSINGRQYAKVDALIRNVIPDFERDFHIQVKAHLCTNGAGVSTARTVNEIRTILSDVTKILSQCGFVVTLSVIVTTTVPVTLVDNLGSGSEKVTLFSYDHDDVALDVYFVQKIDGGTVPGVTLTPDASGWTSEAGVAIADTIGPNGEVALVGQLVVRTLAHEIGHYLLNHALPDFTDHRDDDKNLMYWDAVETKRDLDSAQCLEMRSDYAND